MFWTAPETAVAEALKQSKPQGSSNYPDHRHALDQWRADVTSIAYALGLEREHFDQAEFIAACGGPI